MAGKPARGWETVERMKVLSLVASIPEAIASKDIKAILDNYDTRNSKFCAFEDDPEYLLWANGAKFEELILELLTLESIKIRRDVTRVDLLTRNVSVVTGLDDWEATRNGMKTVARSRFTIVLWKRIRWKIIHEHFTRI